MKPLENFTLTQWLSARPLIDSFKQVRNDLLTWHFCRQVPNETVATLKLLSDSHQNDGASDLLISIAFDKPEIIELQLAHIAQYGSNVLTVVADNSPSSQARSKIRTICKKANVTYIALPYNRSRHANRSHGMAMQWCYENIVRILMPSVFAFIDHDLIPVKSFNLGSQIGSQPIYGVIWENKDRNAWQLWAGYCIYRVSAIGTRKLNFLYDFSNGLDTGWRNFHRFYRYLIKSGLVFADNVYAYGQQPFNRVQVIDNCWLHLGGAGHRNNFKDRFTEFCSSLSALKILYNWSVTLPPFERYEQVRPFKDDSK